MDTIAVTEFLARSTTLTSVGWIGYIIIGAIAGWVAKHLMHVKESFVVTILVGIAGALIGGFILSFFVNTEKGGWWFTLFTDPRVGDPARAASIGPTPEAHRAMT
jgi:uncharacterized membrane protein YeaQ/YmgE (transglycosylase-associated protein family)